MKIIVRISLAMFVLGAFVLGQFITPSPTSTPAAAKTYTPAPTIDRSSTVQAKRKDLIERMMAERLISKVDVPGSLPRVHVLPRFYSLDFDERQRTVSVVAAYMGQASDHYPPRVFDAGTNKSVGRLTQQVGPVMK